MGGLLSEIEDSTTSLMLESANFDGVSVRKSATKLGMRTEASARYEKTLDPEITVPAIERFLKLLLTIDPDAKVITSLTDSYRKHYDTIEINFDKAYVDKYTGIDITVEAIEKTLTALGFVVARTGNDFHVVVPSYRATKDVTIKADIIEEITRIYGYDNFDLQSTKSLLAPIRPDKARENEYRAKQMLADRFAYNEVHSYIWYDNKQNKELGIEAEGDVLLVNNEISDNNTIRRTLLPSLLGFAAKNCNTYPDIRLFEIGRAVQGLKEDGLCNERKLLTLINASKTKTENQLLKEVKEVADTLIGALKNRTFAYNEITEQIKKCPSAEKRIPFQLLHPKNCALLCAEGTGKVACSSQKCENVIGYISVLNPKLADKIDKKLHAAVLELDYTLFAEIEAKAPSYTELSKFPGINIDLSILVDKDTAFGTVADIVNSYSCDVLQSCQFVDLFHDDNMPEGKSSMTIRMQFMSYTETLALDTVNTYKQDILNLLKQSGFEMRDIA